MQKLVEGKLYDTEKAEKIAEEWNGLGNTDFRNCSEILYKTTNGAYFLYGEGGPLTRYAVPVGSNGHGAGEDIEPMTEGEAFDWLQTTGHIKEAQEEFPDMIQEA